MTAEPPESSSATNESAPETTTQTKARAGALAASPQTRSSNHPRKVARPQRPHRQSLWEKLEAWISRLSTRNNFWHRVCSLIWLPYAFKSGIRMAKSDPDNYSYILPFRRFNKNWYSAMAGAALLGNSEVAGGMYIFNRVGKDHTVVCKELNYRFLRPCFGPAVYKIVPNKQLDEQIAAGGEFNVELTINIYQPPNKPSDREKRVGRCRVVFHVTPKMHHRERRKAGRSPAIG